MTLRQCRKFVILLISVMSGLVLVFVFFGKLALSRWAAASHTAFVALTTHFNLLRISLLEPQKRLRILLLVARLFSSPASSQSSTSPE